MRTSLLVVFVVLSGCSALQGPRGDTGPAGPTGPAGADGARGLQGAQGAPGQTGMAGADGMQGPIGGGLYVSKASVYCNEASPPGTNQAVASCNDANDLLVSGGCVDAAAPGTTGYFLSVSRPRNVAGGGPAEWYCIWSAPAGTPNVDLQAVGAKTVVCCINVPGL